MRPSATMVMLVLVGLLLLHTGACQPVAADPYEELAVLIKAMEQNVANQDPAAFASYHAKDSTVLFPNGQLAEGRAEMEQVVRMMMEAGVKGVKFETYDTDFSADREMGNFWCDHTYFDANHDVIDTAKALVTTCREDGKLKIDDVVFASTVFTTLSSKYIRHGLEDFIERQEEAWKNHDYAGMADGMTDDGIVMLPGMDVVRGKEESVKAAEQVLSTLGDTEINYEPEEVQMIDPKWGYVWGYYTITDGSKTVVDKGKYLALSVLEDGEVKDHRFMMNSNKVPTTCTEPPRDEL